MASHTFTFAFALQWRKSMMLEAQTKLLADVQLVVDAPGRIQAALEVQVRNPPSLLICTPPPKVYLLDDF